MIHLQCPDCGWVLFGKAVSRVDAASADLTCLRCKCIIRATLVKLHDGDLKYDNHVDLQGVDPVSYTYDKNHNRVLLKTKETSSGK